MNETSDLTPAPRPNWRKAAIPIVIAAALVFLGGEIVDWRWEKSLRQARCTVMSAKTEGRVHVSGGTTGRHGFRRTDLKAQWIEDTTVQFHVDGVGPRTAVVPGGSSDFPVGLVLDCWVAGEEVHLDPEDERFYRRLSHSMWSANVVLVGFLGFWAWHGLKKSGLEWPF